MLEYAIRIRGYIWKGENTEEEQLLRSLSGAKRLVKRMEDADKVFDIPDPPKRTIMFREVGPWHVAKDKEATDEG